MIEQWHIVISGLRDDAAGETGCDRLWRALHVHAAPERAVLLLPWDTPWFEVARQIAMNSLHRSRLCVYAHSLGAGSGLLGLAASLVRPIHHAVLCDPLLEHYWPMTPAGTRQITLPANVRRVDWFRQQDGAPFACDLIPAGPSTVCTPATFVAGPHHTADQAEAWHVACLDAAF